MLIDNKLAHSAQPNTAYLTGRILTVAYPNPKFDPSRLEGEKNQKTLTEQVVMLPNNIRESKSLTLINASPLAFELPQGAVTHVPTGVLHKNSRKEHKVECVGPRVIEHGGAFVFKSLDAFFAVPA